MRIASFLFLFIFTLFLFTEKAEAKVLPQASKAGKQATISKSSGGSIGVSPRLRGDRKALIVYFSNLGSATSVSYFLTYKTSTQDEGAVGGLNLTGSTATQELLFATCSKNVCRYHIGINNMRLEISYTAKSGKTYLRKYRIKV